VGAGVAAYLLYTYLELAVSPPFSALYLGYIGTFATASWALVAQVAGIDPAELAARVDLRAPRRAVAGWGVFLGLGLAMAWLGGIVAQTTAGDFGYPVGAAAVGHVVHALDLGLQVPLALATAVLLLRRAATGWLVASIFVVQGTCMSAALVGMVGTTLALQGQSLLGAAPFAGMFLVGVTLCGLVFRSIHDRALEPGARAVDLHLGLVPLAPVEER
jgi:hypothetical protein